MATVQRYVNTASSGGDGTTNNTSGATAAYASLSSWEANSGGSATDDYIVDCCGTAADTTAVTVDFAVNITTGSITIRGNRSDAAGFYDGNVVISTSHYRLNAGDNALTCSENNITVDGIQVIPTGANFRHGIGLVNGFITVKNCRLHTTSSTQIGIGLDSAIGHNNPTTIENNLIVNFSTGVDYTADSFRTPTVTIRHNTIYGDGTAEGIRIQCQSNGGGTWVVKANAVGATGNALTDLCTGVGTASVTYADNAFDNTESTTDEIALGTAASAWTSPGTTASSDFTVKDTSSSLYNAVNPTLVTTDITGFTRDGTNHDVGAFELQSGGGLVGPLVRGRLLRRGALGGVLIR